MTAEMKSKEIVSDIPELTAILKEAHSLPFLFIGAGFSRRYLNLPDWQGLLKIFAKKAKNIEFAYEAYQDEMRLSSGIENNLPLIAEAIEKDFNKVWFSNSEYKVSREKYSDYIKAGVSPFKIEISAFFINWKEKVKNKLALDELNCLKSAGKRSIAGIITTNYDTLIEESFKYQKFIGQEDLLFSPIYGIAEIYKIHGCCEQPSSLILTANDYAEFNKKNAYLAAKLMTVFLEHPIVFMGYSINDPNVEEILKAISNCLSQEKLDLLKQKLIFIDWNEDIARMDISGYSKSFESGKIIEMTKITISSFLPVYRSLLQNKSQYNPKLLRQIKQDLYKIVAENIAVDSVKIVDIENDTEIEKAETVIGIGVAEQLKQKGYTMPSAEDIYLDIVLDNGHFDNEHIVEKTLPVLLRQQSGSMPLYKYLSNYKKEIPIDIAKLKKEDFDSFVSQSLKKQRGNMSYNSIEEVLQNNEANKSLFLIALLTENQIKCSKLDKFLKEYLNTNPDIFKTARSADKTNFRRLIKIYDWLKYYKEKKPSEDGLHLQ